MKAMNRPAMAFGLLLAAMLGLPMALLGGLLPGNAAPEFPALTGRVVDQAGLLSPADEAELTRTLAELEAKSSDQLVIVTLNSLQGYPIEDFGYQLGRHWGIGQKDTDNGVLLIVAPNERKVRVEVGRGLEPIVTDSLARLVIETTILPRFRRGDFVGGIKAGATDIRDIMLGDAEEVKNRLARFKPRSEIDYEGIIVMAIWLAFIIFIIWRSHQQAKNGPRGPGSGVGRRRGNSDWVIVPGPGGRGGSGGWSGGGSGGGFGGGGGGFGGGGASGGW